MLTKNFVVCIIRAQISKVNDLMLEIHRIKDTNLNEHKPMSDIIIGTYLSDMISDFLQTLCKVDLYSVHPEMTISAKLNEIYDNYIEWCGHTISSLNELNDQLPDLYLSDEDSKRFDPKNDPLYRYIDLAWNTACNSRTWMTWPGYIDHTIEYLSDSVLNFKQGIFLMKKE